MPLVVDNTPLSPTCNSYASVEEMAAYLSERVADPTAATSWTALTSDQKAMYLINATRSIDSFCDWNGRRVYNYDYQKLGWPRYNVRVDGLLMDVDTTVFPTPVIEATCEMAMWLMQNDGVVSQQQNLALDSIKIGPLAIDFNEDAGGVRDKYFPDIVAIILKDLAVLNNPQLPGSRQVRTVTLYRA